MHMMVMLPLTSKSVHYDPVKDFQAVGRIATFYEGLAVPAALPVRDVREWLALANNDKSKATYGVPAAGSVAQFIGYRLGSDAKVELTSSALSRRSPWSRTSWATRWPPASPRSPISCNTSRQASSR